MPLTNRLTDVKSEAGFRQTDGLLIPEQLRAGREQFGLAPLTTDYRPHPKARISLVGAGPGDPELITLKAIRAIESADVILYDSLANPALLDYNPLAQRVFVGKRKGWQRYSQYEINALLLEFAKRPLHIIRLKGGDPMVFGRAMEEITTVKAHNIPVEVIPGISSYAGMAAQLQLPITQRGVSRSFWVVTGTNKNGQLTQDMKLAAQSSATVIVYMGMSKLTEIVALFAQYQPNDYPVSIIQNATRPEVRQLDGQLGNIVALQAIAQLGSPGLLVFGIRQRVEAPWVEEEAVAKIRV